MKDTTLRFRKNTVLFAVGLMMSTLFGFSCCLMLALAIFPSPMSLESTSDISYILLCFAIAAPVFLPLFTVSIAGALMAGHHRRAYVTITEEGLTIHDIVLFRKVSHHRFAIKAATRSGNDLVLSIWDRQNPKQQRINLGLLEGNDVETLMKWLEGQGVSVTVNE